MSKTIPLGDLAKLKRFMGQTMSEHDGEALNALRFANKLLKQHGLTWEEIFARQVGAANVYHPTMTPLHERRPGRSFEYSDDDRVEESIDELETIKKINIAFETLKGKVRGSFGEFVAKMDNKWRSTSYLTPAERSAIINAAARQR